MNSTPTPMREGQFVQIPGDGRGIAKIVAGNDATVTIEYFESVAVRYRDEVPWTAVCPAQIYAQTRCYLWNEAADVWQAGRVVQCVDGKYLVDFPGQNSQYVGEAKLYVRSSHPVRDPVEVLVSRAHDTPFFHERRFPFVRALTEQRAAARGLTGLLSSRILLYPHQVEIARRVLEDPVQRYLLSDEVGLGKTIEAGIIIRQFLLDHRRGRVLVLVPSHLREQWRFELKSKFAAFDAPGRVLLLGTGEWEGAPELEDVGLVVIDEAHHVAELASSSDPSQQARFDLYRRLALSAPRLLLLSATPALNNEAAFLALLHLLEPEVYQLEDVELLRARLTARQEVGRFLLAFNERSPAFTLRRGLSFLAELVHDDPYLAGLTAQLRDLLEAESANVEARTRLVREIRSHIGDRYRLHRRLVRTRRETVGDGVTTARLTGVPGSGQLVEENDDGEISKHQQDLVEEWREAAFVAWSRAEPGEESEAAALLPLALLALLDAVVAGGSVLAAAVDCRLGHDSGEGLEEDLGTDAVRALRGALRFEGENGLLQQLRDTAVSAERDDLLIATVKAFAPRSGPRPSGPPQKVLVFTSFPTVRRRIAAQLEHVYGTDAVASFGAENSAVQVDARVARFRDVPECWLLVCDRSGEEGCNLQWTDCLVHFDLPFSPNRMEQRIGRLDRIGRDRAVRSRVLLGPERDGSLYEAWYRVLRDGFGVFHSSIAGLQFYVDAHLPDLVHALLRGGEKGLLEAIPRMREEIAAERARLAEQYALDEIDVLDRGATEYFRELSAHDSGSDRLRAEFEGWVCRGLQFEVLSHPPVPGAIRYQPRRGSLVPGDLLVERLSLTVVRRPGTFVRELAAQAPELTLYRMGEPLVDFFEGYIDWDDRGRAFAIWRCDTRLDATPGAEWTGFRFDYVVEADTERAEAVLKTLAGPHATPTALRRRADGYLPPMVETVFVDSDGVEIDDALLLDILKRPYRKREERGSDYSLAKERLPAMDLVVDPALWPALCRDARGNGERMVLSRPELSARLATTASRAEATMVERIARLHRRAASAASVEERTALAAETELEERIADALIAGVREPRLRLDSVGFYVLSGRDPFR